MTMKNQSICKLYTYPCAGTGGPIESMQIYGNAIDKSASWDGHAEEWHNMTFKYRHLRWKMVKRTATL